MSVIPLLPERRRNRSNNTYEAIKLQLEWIQKEQDLKSFVLADSRGLILSFAGRAEDAHALAAYAPVVAACTDKNRYYDIVEKVAQFVPEANLQNIAFRTFEVEGETMHLCLLGDAGQLNHANIYRAVSGVRRIVDESRIAA